MTETEVPDVYAQGRCDQCGQYGQTRRYTIVAVDGSRDIDVCPSCSILLEAAGLIDRV